MTELLHETVAFLQGRGFVNPEFGIISGTGLGNLFPEHIQEKQEIPYAHIPHFPVSTVESHHGNLQYGDVHGRKVLSMQGRLHYYEGYSMQQITFPVRVMKMLGIKYLLISNAAGNLNPHWETGELMLLDDHINLLPDNPLRGKNYDVLGPRFPDMSQPYSKLLQDKLLMIAAGKKIKLHKGVYAAVSGPNLETRAEYRFLQKIGCDAVGMSTVPEVIVANHMNLPCCAISALTDDCNPDNLQEISLAEIVQAARHAEPLLTELYIELIRILD